MPKTSSFFQKNLVKGLEDNVRKVLAAKKKEFDRVSFQLKTKRKELEKLQLSLLDVKRDGNNVVKHVQVVASIEETGEIMKPGMTVRAEILVDHLDQALSQNQQLAGRCAGGEHGLAR